MRVIDVAEANKIVSPSGFHIESNEFWQTNNLCVADAISNRHRRTECAPSETSAQLPSMILEMNRIFPPNARRLLLVERDSRTFPYLSRSFQAIRQGNDEYRDIFSAPAHVFGPHDFSVLDQMLIDDHMANDLGLMTGLISLIFIDGWVAKLVAEGSSDIMEFWEGNVLYYSESAKRIEEANGIFRKYKFKRGLN